MLQDVIPTDYITLADITENTISKLDLTKGIYLIVETKELLLLLLLINL